MNLSAVSVLYAKAMNAWGSISCLYTVVLLTWILKSFLLLTYIISRGILIHIYSCPYSYLPLTVLATPLGSLLPAKESLFWFHIVYPYPYIAYEKKHALFCLFGPPPTFFDQNKERGLEYLAGGSLKSPGRYKLLVCFKELHVKVRKNEKQKYQDTVTDVSAYQCVKHKH